MAEKESDGSQLFQCDVCHYSTLVKTSYDKHMYSAKHLLLVSNTDSNIYRCDSCDYITIKKSSYDKHLSTTKHKLQLRVIKNNEGKLVCNYCNKTYISRPGLWAHKKKCVLKNKKDGDPVDEDEDNETQCDEVPSDEKEEDDVVVPPRPLENTIVYASSPPSTMVGMPFDFSASDNQDNQVNIDAMNCPTINDALIPSNVIIQLFKENQQMLKKTQDFQSLFIEQQRENKDLINKLFDMTQQQLAMTTNITNNTVNNNQRFNLNVFLNETCKDAMNLDEFLDTIRPTFDELLVMGDVGFVDGISDIFIKRLRALDITKRPIHCTDAKRETIFLKENNVWTKDDNGHSRLNSIIEKVEYRNVVCLHQWCLDNPDAMVNNHEKNLLRDKIYLQTLLGDPKTREKVVKNIAKEVALDREAIMLQFGRK